MLTQGDGIGLVLIFMVSRSEKVRRSVVGALLRLDNDQYRLRRFAGSRLDC